MQELDSIRKDHIGRINKVMMYIEKNLDKDLSVRSISEVACFSPYHFHRIFTAITGETINAFIIRKRIEHIASRIIRKSELPLSELAYKFGFNSPSAFSRAFKNYYGISPTEFRNNSSKHYSKICKVDSKNCKEQITFEQYICSVNQIKNWIKMNAKIEVKEMPELKLAYASHVGEYKEIKHVFEKLMQWAGPKGLLNTPDLRAVTIYHDDPKVTEISKVRQSACITVEEEIKPEGEFGYTTIPTGKFAVGSFKIDQSEFETAWNSMCVWVTENGYSFRDGEYFEIYYNDCKEAVQDKFIVDICIPVE